MSAFSRGLLILALVAVAPCEALGQVDSSDAVQHRNNCRLASQTLRTSHPLPKLQWARTYIALCKEEGPNALVSLWTNAGPDSAEAHYLITNSSILRDARLYDELRALAVDRSRPDIVRVAAMLVLVRYANPTNFIVLSDLAPPDGPIGRIPLLSRWSTGIRYTSGSVPLPSPVAPEILRVLTTVAETPSESRAVYYAAAALARSVRMDIDHGWAH